jgi:hypothetical protein
MVLIGFRIFEVFTATVVKTVASRDSAVAVVRGSRKDQYENARSRHPAIWARAIRLVFAPAFLAPGALYRGRAQVMRKMV